MSAFAQLKKNREAASERLRKQIEENAKGGGKSSYKDERFYYPERDKQGNGYAVIRFLPEKGHSMPFVRLYKHQFQGPGGKWLFENCPTTLGKDHSCPICEANSEAYQKGEEYYKKHAAYRKRKTSFVSNILVVSDPKNPENEGKVFLFSYGTKIMDMITSAMKPEFEDEVAMNPFDFWEGANFQLKIIKKDGNTNYDRSKFESPSKLGTDAEMEAIFEKEYDISEFVDPAKFKSYEELQEKFSKVMNEKANSRRAADESAGDDDDAEDEAPATSKPEVRNERVSRKPAQETAKPSPKADSKKPAPAADDEDPLAFFESLAEGKV